MLRPLACLVLALAAAGAAQAPAQQDPCDIRPDLPGCAPQPPPGPAPVPAPVDGMPWTEAAAWILLAAFAVLAAAKHFDVLPRLLAMWDTAIESWRRRRSDRARFGDDHASHHRKRRRPRKPQVPPPGFA